MLYIFARGATGAVSPRFRGALLLLVAGCSSGQTPYKGPGDGTSEGAPADVQPSCDRSLPILDVGRQDATAADQQLADSGPATKWITISSGVFTMGSPATEACRQPVSERETAHQVTLTRSFEMHSTEVTQAQFEALMGYNPSRFNTFDEPCGAPCPVEKVSWHEAAAYCNALSQAAGLTSCYACQGTGESVQCNVAAQFAGGSSAYVDGRIYTCPGYRLPTGPEWEHAYRAGTSTAYYSGTNDAARCQDCTAGDPPLDAIAWYCANANRTTHPVARKQPNAAGLYDMAGNVNEWVHDWVLQDLGSTPVTDPWIEGSYKVFRGGSWNEPPARQRAAYRTSDFAGSRHSNVGFRCVRTLSP